MRTHPHVEVCRFVGSLMEPFPPPFIWGPKFPLQLNGCRAYPAGLQLVELACGWPAEAGVLDVPFWNAVAACAQRTALAVSNTSREFSVTYTLNVHTHTHCQPLSHANLVYLSKLALPSPTHSSSTSLISMSPVPPYPTCAATSNAAGAVRQRSRRQIGVNQTRGSTAHRRP